MAPGIDLALNLGQNQRLAIPLIKWFAQQNPSGRFYHQQTNSLWVAKAMQWTQYGGILCHTHQLSFHSHGKVDRPPPLQELEKATTAQCGQKLILKRCCACEQSPQGVDPCQQMWESPISWQWELDIFLTCLQWEMMEALLQGGGCAVSDGSFKDAASAAAWIIKGPTLELRLTGQWHMPGPSEGHSSFHSELAGIVGVLYTLSFWPLKTVKSPFRLACNRFSVVLRLQTTQLIDPTEPHADLLIVAQILLTTSKYRVELAFVHSHQDTGYPTVLTQDAWLNVKANSLAKAMVSVPFMGPSHFKLPGSPWGCYMENKCIVTQLQPSLQKFINGNTTLSYWGKRKQCSYNQMQEIDWMSLGWAM